MATKSAVILKDHSNWDDWIELLKTACRPLEIWQYVNPDVAEPPTLPEPKMPEYKEDMTAAEAAVYTIRGRIFEDDRKIYRKKKLAIAELQIRIQETIDKSNLIYTYKCETAHEMLVNLKDRFAPSDSVRKREAIIKWKSLQTIENKDVDKWLKDYEDSYKECVSLKIAEITGYIPLHDFLGAVNPIAPHFSGPQMVDILKAEERGDPANLKELLKLFHKYHRSIKDHRKSSGTPRAFPATFQGRNSDGEQSDQPKQQSQNEKKSKCVCGGPHRYQDCWHLFDWSSKRPKEFKSSEGIQKKIDEALRNNEKARKEIEKIRSEHAALTPTPTASSTPSARPASYTVTRVRVETKKQRSEDRQSLHLPRIAGAAYYTGSDTSNEEVDELHDSFILDSGATIHICNNRDRFLEYRESDGRDLLKVGDHLIPIAGFGRVLVNGKGPNGPISFYLAETAHAPTFFLNIISTNRMVAGGLDWSAAKAMLLQDEKPHIYTPKMYGSWVVEYNPIKSTQSVYKAHSSRKPKPILKGSTSQWHDRLGHVYPEAIAHLEQKSQGVKVTPSEHDPACEVCRLADASKIISRRSQQRAKEPYEKAHWDLISMKPGIGDAVQILHLLDDMTRMNHIYILRNKNQESVISTLQSFVHMVNTRFGYIVRIFRHDNDRSLGKKWDEWLRASGITSESSAVYTPEQNGAAERSGGVLLNRATKLRLAGGLPEELWPEVIPAAGYLLNRTPTKSLGWESPIGMLGRITKKEDEKPMLGHIRSYGSRAYVYKHNRPRLDKLSAKALVGYLVGYDSTNIWRIWIPSSGKIISTRDVTFDENRRYTPGEELPIQELAIKTLAITRMEEVDDSEDEGVMDLEQQPANRDITSPESANQEQAGEAGKASKEASIPQQRAQLITPEQTPEPIGPNSDDFHGDSRPDSEHEEEHVTVPTNQIDQNLLDLQLQESSDQQQFMTDSDQPSTDALSRRLPRFAPTPTAPRDIRGNVSEENILAGKRQRIPKRQAYAVELSSIRQLSGFHSAFATAASFHQAKIHRTELPPPPKGWKDLLYHPHRTGFEAAAQKEYRDLQTRGTFKSVPKNMVKGIPLPMMWVFTYKYDTDGYLIKYKARLVIRGDLQNTQFQDTYAATLATRVFRVLMAIAAQFDLEMAQFDAVNAFINSLLDIEVYVQPPPGFPQSGNYLQLFRALYGLPRSPLLWQKDLSRKLMQLGLQATPEANCIFMNQDLVVFFYVDDICVLYHRSKQEAYESFRTSLLAAYEMREIGDMKWFLGIRVIRDREQRKLWLCQDAYLDQIAGKYGLTNQKAPQTPMQTQELLPNTREASDHDILAYQQKVGSITYATTITRPDAARASQKLAEFLQNPSPEHHAAADRVIIYLYHTRTYALEYGSTNQTAALFRSASDAAYADDPETRRSTEGYCFHLFGGIIDWKSSKQKTVTTSTTEAELLSLSHASSWLVWWQRFFASITLDLDQDYTIECDNLQTVRLMLKEAPKLETKLKHVDIHRHWLKQEVENGHINIKWVPTSEMAADGFTKALPRQKHEDFIRHLNMVNVDQLIELRA